MKRQAEQFLTHWRDLRGHKPLVLKGAWQVGKAYLEQFVGQELLCAAASFEDPQLFYWERETRNANAEVDFVISRHQDILPVEAFGSTRKSANP
ncbi:MAG: DUF4143 domain-containing protein [Verrucomicrobia bacterium]|nr:DUF4143 domain-containing protein [Verrucomicrobiota bacterium]